MKCFVSPSIRSILIPALLFGAVALRTLPQAHAQNGVDPVFGGASLGLYLNVWATAASPDGKLLVGGSFPKNIVRLNPDGSEDSSFKHDDFHIASVDSIAVQDDGKIIVGGIFSSIGSVSRGGIARLNADGSLDPSFDAGAIDYEIVPGVSSSMGSVSKVAILPDGKSIVSLEFYDVHTSFGVHAKIARLRADGSMDPSFQSALQLDGHVTYLAPQPDGKVVLGGFFSQAAGYVRDSIARLNADGTLDTGFDPGSLLTWTGTYEHRIAAVIAGTGQPVIVGNFSAVAGVARQGIARLNADGSLDSAFGQDSAVNNLSGIYDFHVQADGKFVLAGTFSSVNGVPRSALARLNSDGTLDTGFDPGGPNRGVEKVAVAPDDTLFVTGPLIEINGVTRTALAHVYADGTADPRFIADVASGPNATVTAVAVLPDGKILISGYFSLVNGAARDVVARLNADGTVDQGFSAPSYNVFPSSYILVQADGKVVLGAGMTRLNTDGTIDKTFVVTVHFSPEGSPILTAASQPDGKIFVAGIFDQINGVARANLARLNADGTLDASFDPGSNDAGFELGIAVQSDGKVIMVGRFTQVQGVPRPGVARFNADGSLDQSFNPAVTGFVLSVTVLRDGKIVLGGNIDVSGGAKPKKYAVRLNPDGTMDNSFDTGLGLTNPQTVGLDRLGVLSIVEQPDGKLIVAGNFKQYSGGSSNVARLNLDGSIDPFFNPGSGTDAETPATALQADGKLIIGGSFRSVNGVLRNYVARLSSGGVPDFFGGQVAVGGGFYYMAFPNGSPFGYYNLAGDGYTFPYLYHADLGMEYFIDAQDGFGGAYLYDFASGGFFYTSPKFAWPYLYDFSLRSVLYYYPDPTNPGRYNTGGVRYFYNYATGQIITK